MYEQDDVGSVLTDDSNEDFTDNDGYRFVAYDSDRIDITETHDVFHVGNITDDCHDCFYYMSDVTRLRIVDWC